MEGDDSEPSDGCLIEMLKENWLHARHVENERLWFTNIYAIIVAGILAFFGQASVDGELVISQYTYLFVFLLVLSFFGLIVTAKVNLEFSNHMNAVKKIIKKLNLQGYMAFPTAYRGELLGKIIRVRYAFLGLYLMMSLIWVYLLYLSLV